MNSVATITPGRPKSAAVTARPTKELNRTPPCSTDVNAGPLPAMRSGHPARSSRNPPHSRIVIPTSDAAAPSITRPQGTSPSVAAASVWKNSDGSSTQ